MDHGVTVVICCYFQCMSVADPVHGDYTVYVWEQVHPLKHLHNLYNFNCWCEVKTYFQYDFSLCSLMLYYAKLTEMMLCFQWTLI